MFNTTTMKFQRFNRGNVRYCTLRLLRIPTFGDWFKMEENKFRYTIVATNMCGDTQIGKRFRENNRTEEFILNDVNTNLNWCTDLTKIRGVKRTYLFRVKRPLWAISISGRTYDYGIGSVWNDGSIVTDNDYINIIEDKSKIQYIELE